MRALAYNEARDHLEIAAQSGGSTYEELVGSREGGSLLISGKGRVLLEE